MTPTMMEREIQTPSGSLTPGQIIAKNQAKAPVNVVAVASDLGIKVWAMHSLPPTVSGKLFIDPLNGGWSGFSIGVNAEEPTLRKRFTVAHEIAHFILHRNKIENGEIVDDTLYRSGLSSREETEANRLAADILMPYKLISALMHSGRRDPESLADALQVSLPAMKIRLGIPLT